MPSKLYMDRPIKRWGLSWAQRRPKRAKPRSDSEIAADEEKQRAAKENAETWDHPEAAQQRELIEKTYGGKPASIADFWSR